MKTRLFEREHEVLEKARAASSPEAEDYKTLLSEYEKLLRQSEKIVTLGDSAQNRLVRAQKMLHRALERYKTTAARKSEILALVSHEIKNKATPIRELARMALEEVNGVPGAEHASEMLRHVTDAADQLIRSVNGTLLRESGNSESVVPVFEWSDVSLLAESSVRNQAPSAAKKNIVLKSEIAPRCETLADEFLLGEVFENLVGNAIKFSGGGTAVSVLLARKEDSIVFSVRDEGPGLTDDDKRKLFRKYQTLSAKPTGGESSSGIGLYLSDRIVAMHKGSLTAASEGSGKGATFTVTLPIPIEKCGIPGLGTAGE
jgi:signal transduction histidine kinase